MRYQVKNGPGSVMMIPSQSTTASLQNLVPNAEYYVSVAGINSCGGTSAFEMANFTLKGNSYMCIHMVSVVLCLATCARVQRDYNFFARVCSVLLLLCKHEERLWGIKPYSTLQHYRLGANWFVLICGYHMSLFHCRPWPSNWCFTCSWD